MRKHSSPRRSTLVSASLLVLGLATACGSSRESGFDDVWSQGSPVGGSLASGGSEKEGTCAAKVASATRAEVDVILVVDTSSSMGEEIAQVKDNLNAFASAIAGSGLDYQVLVIAKKPSSSSWGGGGLGVCIPEPLAGPGCADKPPLFHHLNVEVDSWNSLKQIVDQFPNYSSFLRPTSYKVFIEVTDDNSSPLKWHDFDQRLLATSSDYFGTETSRKYIFNSICGWERGTSHFDTDKCGSADSNGEEYQRLSDLTGGTIESVCESDYSSVFDNIAQGLVAKLGCEFAFPKTDTGIADPAKIVVNYTPGNGSSSPLTQVTDASKCAGFANAWYYDDNTKPTKLVFCPSTCSGPGADTAGKLEIAVGCTAPPPS